MSLSNKLKALVNRPTYGFSRSVKYLMRIRSTPIQVCNFPIDVWSIKYSYRPMAYRAYCQKYKNVVLFVKCFLFFFSFFFFLFQTVFY